MTSHFVNKEKLPGSAARPFLVGETKLTKKCSFLSNILKSKRPSQLGVSTITYYRQTSKY